MTPSWHIETFGETGPTVLLLHSSGLSGRQWRRLAATLSARGFRAVVPDLTGHGASPPWPEPTPFSYRQEVDVLVARLRAEQPTHLVGHSYGGLIAGLAAIDAPERLLSLTLFDPVAFGVLDPALDADAGRELGAVDEEWGTSESQHERWLQSFVDYWGGSGAWLALREDARAEFRRVGWVVEQEVTTLMGDRTPASAYRVVTCPVTLMTGELSPLAAHAVVRHLAQAFPRARVVTVAGAGHMGPMSHADRVNDAVLAQVTSA